MDQQQAAFGSADMDRKTAEPAEPTEPDVPSDPKHPDEAADEFPAED
ncbi:hypothetical protein [Nocardia jiangsuensis]|uniref:Uncharacterized protein n=1 Tax=Nocardia jiangsuensis TaxID=1691563 RepID=A0ABV8DYN3_9NOCA